jgi:pimeloyl-ACP methyl ester carboxylesterase
VAIAYGVVGEGPIDLVYLQGFVSDVEMMWELPQAAAFLERLARWSRLITIDRRGVGMSDRFTRRDAPPLEDAAADILCVLDAIGSDRAALLGHNEGGQICAMLAATAPERVRSLSLFSTPISKRRQEVEEGADPESLDRENTEWARRFGTTSFDQELFSSICPSYVADPDMFDFMLHLQRHATSPGGFTGVVDLLYHTDLTGILGSIRVPTQVLHRTGDRLNPIGWSRRLAAAIPGAEFIELKGEDWWPFLGDADALLDEVERFVLGAPVGRPEERGLGTVSSPTSSAPPRRPCRWATRRGARCWPDTTRWPSARSPRMVGATCRPPAMGSSRCSTGRLGRAGGPSPSQGRSANSAWRSARGCTPERSSTGAATSGDSPCTSALG